ncbi:hypothetical protein BP5796_05655 [Coleophoma crateriformis]|uniref:Uncharacterized protein n=1 Tax=Coleophoma crateriformis TaxID=565419 RepID=A0A3D8S3S1_9HELO|nr:hypothetical protein BP5796_05655 [Coleophoma crateriformis]
MKFGTLISAVASLLLLATPAAAAPIPLTPEQLLAALMSPAVTKLPPLNPCTFTHVLSPNGVCMYDSTTEKGGE